MSPEGMKNLRDIQRRVAGVRAEAQANKWPVEWCRRGLRTVLTDAHNDGVLSAEPEWANAAEVIVRVAGGPAVCLYADTLR